MAPEPAPKKASVAIDLSPFSALKTRFKKIVSGAARATVDSAVLILEL